MSRSFHASDGCRQRRYERSLRRLVVAMVLGVIASWGANAGPAEAGPAQPARIDPPLAQSEQPLGLGEPGPRNVADLRAIQARVEAIADHVRQCTVGLIVGEAQGSGVIVSENGLVLTAAHVSDGLRSQGHGRDARW